jgi:hypothetical protein
MSSSFGVQLPITNLIEILYDVKVKGKAIPVTGREGP